MKTFKFMSILFLALCLTQTVFSQKKIPIKNSPILEKPRTNAIPVVQTVTVRPTQTTGTTTPIKPKVELCKPMDIASTENILRDKVGRTLRVHLDKDYGSIEIMGKTINVAFEPYKVRSIAREWVYSLNDIRSTITRVEYKNNKYVMTIEFENDGTEIKGLCPSCITGGDRRAPDINWDNPALEIVMTPVAYNKSLTFQVDDVVMKGKFNLNGLLDKFFPPIALYFQKKLENTFKEQMQNTFNSDEVKRALADVFVEEVHRVGLTEVLNVDSSANNIFLCNYIRN